MAYRTQKLTFEAPTGYTVAAILTEPTPRTDKLVVLCHGFSSHKRSRTNERLTELLNDHGISTFCFDWFGMGESDGRMEDLLVSACCRQLTRALQLVRTLDYTRMGLIGSSFGGLIVLLVAAQDTQLAAIGLKCPVPDFPEMLRRQFGPSNIERWRTTGMLPSTASTERVREMRFAFYEDCLSHNAYDAAASLTAPTLVVHGDQDDIVPIHQIEQLHRVLPSTHELRLMPGANHTFGQPNDFRHMTVALTQWMHTHLHAP